VSDEKAPRYSPAFFQSYPIRMMSAIEASQDEAEERVEIASSAPFRYPSRDDRRQIMRMIPGDTQMQREIVELEKALTWARRAPRYVEPWWLRFLRWIERHL
jgi:hypothetical protein